MKTNVNEDLYDEVLQTLEILKRLEKPDPPLVTGACNAKARGPFLGAVILACLFQWRARVKSPFSGHQSRPSAAFLYATSCSKGFRVRIVDVACRVSLLLNWNLIHCFQVPSACTTARSSSTDCFPARQTPPTPSGCELSQTVMTGARCRHRQRYRLRLTAPVSCSPLSDVVTVTTEEAAPGPPESVRVIGATTTQLKIAWDPPLRCNGALKGYYVYNGLLMSCICPRGWLLT